MMYTTTLSLTPTEWLRWATKNAIHRYRHEDPASSSASARARILAAAKAEATGGPPDQDAVAIILRSILQDFGRFVGMNSLTLTLHQFPFMVPVSYRALIGKMNNAAIFGAAKGTLMLSNIGCEGTAGVDGTFNQQVTYEFVERPEAPFDYTFTGNGSSGWERVVTQSGEAVIQSTDYTALILPFYRSL